MHSTSGCVRATRAQQLAQRAERAAPRLLRIGHLEVEHATPLRSPRRAAAPGTGATARTTSRGTSLRHSASSSFSRCALSASTTLSKPLYGTDSRS